MGAKATEQRKKYTPQEIANARKNAPEELSKAISALFDDDKNGGIFYAHIIQQMCRIYDDPRIPTAAVSVTDKINLYVNPVFWCLELQDKAQRSAVLKHEIGHLIFHHCYRIADFGNKQLANIAADLVVNSLIDGSVFKEKRKAFIFPENFGMPHDESLPYYYENFPVNDHPICNDPHGHDKEHREKSGDGAGDSKPGPGGEKEDKSHEHAMGPDGKCKVCGGVRTMDYHDVWSEEEGRKISEAMKRSLINDAINRAAEAAEKSAGNLPSAIQQAIAFARKKPQIPWTLILRQFVSRLSTGSLTHTKKRISRRYATRPGPKIVPKLKLLLSVDVSGSISNDEYKIVMNEGLAICRNMGVDTVDVLEWDAAVCSKSKSGDPGTYRLRPSYQVTRTGQGGTDPTPAMEWINANKSRYDGVIWFTDGHFYTNPTLKSKLPELWVLTHNGSDEGLKGKKVIKLPKPAGEKD